MTDDQRPVEMPDRGQLIEQLKSMFGPLRIERTPMPERTPGVVVAEVPRRAFSLEEAAKLVTAAFGSKRATEVTLYDVRHDRGDFWAVVWWSQDAIDEPYELEKMRVFFMGVSLALYPPGQGDEL